jgi:hypothetical protein
MPYFETSDEFYATMRLLFERIRDQQPNPVDTLVENKTHIHLKVNRPTAEITINARRQPVEVSFGNSAKGRPELNIELDADTLHAILLDELSLKKAIANRQVKVIGPAWKTLPLADIFYNGRMIYPQILNERASLD